MTEGVHYHEGYNRSVMNAVMEVGSAHSTQSVGEPRTRGRGGTIQYPVERIRVLHTEEE